MFRKIISSIKFKMIAVCLLVSISFAVLVGYVLYKNMYRNVEADQIRTAGSNLQLVMDSIDHDLYQIRRLAEWCTTDRDILNFLQGRSHSYNSRPLNATAYDAVKAQLFNSMVSQYINKLILASKDGRSVIQGTAVYGLTEDIREVMTEDLFEAQRSSDEYIWSGIVDEPFKSLAGKKGIHLTRKINHSSTGAELGWIFFSFDPAIMIDRLSPYMDDAGYDIYWRIGDRLYIYQNGEFSQSAEALQPMQSDALEDNSSLLQTRIGGKKTKLLQVKSKETGWYLMQTIPKPAVSWSSDAINSMLIPIGLIALSMILLAFLMQRMVSVPVRHIVGHIQRISQGEFIQDNSLNRGDEFGFIGKGINNMTKSIKSLMQKQLEDEKNKRELELSLLQSQVNPHFLYNTLNTIKWIAVIQNASAIVEITESLAMLLKNIAKHRKPFVSLREELMLADEYISIQRYRYIDMFEYSCNVRDPELYDCMILKFSLQPLVENAIFHGIEPSHRMGKITVNIFRSADNMIVEVADNGIGMSKEQIGNLLEKSDSPGEVLQKLGIRNVDSRAKLEYGSEYGLVIDSKPGCYTKITLTLPLLRAEHDKSMNV